ncbi:hypothetical protein Tco_1060085 [Tanacetum coccineum]
MSALNQQTLTDSGGNDRPPMLEKGNYIPWENDTTKQIIESLSRMTEINKKQYTADMRERIKRLIYGFEITNHVIHLRLMDEFDKFAAKEGELLEYVYERLTTLVNIMDRNNVHPISVSINTKFLNCLQPEWRKYVTMASKAKRVARNHDPLRLIAHSNSSSQSHASSSYLNLPQPYYVTHPSLVVDYEEDYQGELHGDAYEDKLINDGRVDIQTKNVGYGRNCNRNVGRQNRNQAFNKGNVNDECNEIVQRVPQTKSNLGNENVQEQMLIAMKDEAGRNLNAKENDFMLDNSFGDKTLKELTAVVIMMARIQPAGGNTMTKPTYDTKAFSEVNASHKAQEQVNHVKRKTII